jgi:hypothetical protein
MINKALKYKQYYWAAEIMLSLYAAYVEGEVESARTEFNKVMPTLPIEVWHALKELNQEVGFAPLDRMCNEMIIHLS